MEGQLRLSFSLTKCDLAHEIELELQRLVGGGGLPAPEGGLEWVPVATPLADAIRYQMQLAVAGAGIAGEIQWIKIQVLPNERILLSTP